MSRKTWNQAAPKAIAANTPVFFTSSEIPSDGLLMLHFGMTGAGGILGGTGLTRCKVRADGDVIIDILSTHLIAFLQSAAPSHPTLTNGVATRFTLPFNLLTAPTRMARDTCQFPLGKAISVELQFGAAGAGTVVVGATYTEDVEPTMYPRLYGNQINVTGATTSGNYPISEPGEIRALVLNTTNLNRAQVVLGKEYVQDLLNTSNLAAEYDQLEQPLVNTVAALIDPRCFLIDSGRSAPSGSSRLQLDVGAGWGATNELTIWSTTPVAARAPSA